MAIEAVDALAALVAPAQQIAEQYAQAEALFEALDARNEESEDPIEIRQIAGELAALAENFRALGETATQVCEQADELYSAAGDAISAIHDSIGEKAGDAQAYAADHDVAKCEELIEILENWLAEQEAARSNPLRLAAR